MLAMFIGESIDVTERRHFPDDTADFAVNAERPLVLLDRDPRDFRRELHGSSSLKGYQDLSGAPSSGMLRQMSTAPYVLGAIAGVAIIKTFFRPNRAVVKTGTVSACPGPNRSKVCDPSLAIATPEGTPVYSTVSGRVAAVGDRFLHLASLSEPVVLMYDGVEPHDFQEGQYVGRGQEIGTSLGQVFFGVTGFTPGGAIVSIDPSSWLASRGQKIATKNTGSGSSWCEAGRHIEVPSSAGRPCNLQEPEKGSFALLPVSVSIDR